MIGVDERIGFGKRLGAALLDSAIMMALTMVIGIVAGGFLGGLMGGAGMGPAAGALGAMAGFLVAMTLVGLLYPVIEGVTGWSPGKRVLGLQIGTADGEPAPLKLLLGRSAIKNSTAVAGFVGTVTGIGLFTGLSGLLALVVFVGCFMTLMASRQALHDRIAGTAVFKADALREAAAMEAIEDAMTEAREPVAAAVEETPDADIDSAVAVVSEAPAERVPGQTRQCPKCGQSDTELGSIIGWYCRICGWRESRG